MHRPLLVFSLLVFFVSPCCELHMLLQLKNIGTPASAFSSFTRHRLAGHTRRLLQRCPSRCSQSNDRQVATTQLGWSAAVQTSLTLACRGSCTPRYTGLMYLSESHTSFLCGWSVGVEFFARLLRDSGVGRDKFRQHLKTFMFASYWRIQRIRGFTFMCYINLR